eukprot:CAMPEP_0172762352 /NCGR_PEP_ID=MMETSP1074-20121228/173324_1 /TAXON_ID=2916 /ORGANISM="Ceratium fusus, Strain PA161109" /LENGTH=36 /DNA_ID= /DNA_START= /DNA_END= /DNA_ORIENTATION=
MLRHRSCEQQPGQNLRAADVLETKVTTCSKGWGVAG